MIVNNGGGLRVQRPENGNDTVSEGIAYGMLMAVYMADKATFDGLWAYAKARRNGKGLMNWHYDANGGVVGNGAATDADEDMGFALVMADKQWGGYSGDANALIAAILARRSTARTTCVPTTAAARRTRTRRTSRPPTTRSSRRTPGRPAGTRSSTPSTRC